MRQMFSKKEIVKVVNEAIENDKIEIPEELPKIEEGDAGKVLKVNEQEDGVEWGEAGGGGGGAFEAISGSKVIKKSGFNTYGIATNNQTGKFAESRSIILAGITSTDGTPIIEDSYSKAGAYGNSEMIYIKPAALSGSSQYVTGGYGLFMGPTYSGSRWDKIRSTSSIFLQNNQNINTSNDTLQVENSLLIANTSLIAPFNSKISDSIIIGNNVVLPESTVQGCFGAGIGISFKNSSNGFLRFAAALGKYNDASALATNMGNGDYFQVGVGSSNTARANCFATGNDGTADYIKIGDTKITETQLQALLALLNNNN